MSNIDHYNYPQLNRKDTMYLSVIRDSDEKIRKFKSLNTKRDFSLSNFNLDIESNDLIFYINLESSPKKFGLLHHKIDFINKTDDIEMASPSTLIPKCERYPNYFNNNKDIEKSCPRKNGFTTNRVPTNPLDPIYNLPVIKEDEYEIPKFIRDSIQVDDIDGARPRKGLKYIEKLNRNYSSEIETRSNRRNFVKKKELANRYIDYKDINEDSFKTKRSVNPLNPVYLLDYGNG